MLGTVYSSQAITEPEAKAIVNKVVQLIETNGIQKATGEVMNPKGPYASKPDLLLNISDFKGVTLAHNLYPKLGRSKQLGTEGS